MPSAPVQLTLAPPADRWAGLVHGRADPRAQRFRREMGLPTDRPIVMTGHQAVFWHPGILAKYLAADALAARAGAACAWIVVDQDTATSPLVRYPALEPAGALAVRTADPLAGADAPGAAAPCIGEGVAAIARALGDTPPGAPPAERIGLATRRLFDPLLSRDSRAAPLLLATRLTATTLFRELLGRMAREPERCIGAYNAAAAAHASAHIRPLVADPVQDRWELPLWRLGTGGERHHVFAEDLPAIPLDRLAPKALLMTGLLRLAGCDLFIHGTGGGGVDEEHGGYDRITEDWLRAWLGADASGPAPVTVATATLTLPLDVAPPPSRADVAHAVWLAHHARHNPLALSDAAHEEQRRASLGRLNAAEPHERPRFFRELHEVLDRYRLSRASGLDELARAAATLRARLGDAAILADRTWAFPLYPREQLETLRDRVHAAIR